MKKILYILLALVLVFSVVGCASTEKSEAVEETKAPVVLGKDGIPRPDWVVKDVSTQDVHFASGYYKAATYANAQKAAIAEARNALAEWVKTSVDEIITSYRNDAGSGENLQAVQAFETISKQNATAMLSGSIKEDEWVDLDGGVYVLVSIPVENVKDQMVGLSDGIAQQFEKNEAAVEANNMMNDAIAKYFGTNATK